MLALFDAGGTDTLAEAQAWVEKMRSGEMVPPLREVMEAHPAVLEKISDHEADRAAAWRIQQEYDQLKGDIARTRARFVHAGGTLEEAEKALAACLEHFVAAAGDHNGVPAVVPALAANHSMLTSEVHLLRTVALPRLKHELGAAEKRLAEFGKTTP